MLYLVEKEPRHRDRSTGFWGQQAKNWSRLWKFNWLAFTVGNAHVTVPEPGVKRIAKESESLENCAWDRDKIETFLSAGRGWIIYAWGYWIWGPSRQTGVSGGLRKDVEGTTHAGFGVRKQAMSRISTTEIGLINTISTESVDKIGEKWKSPENRC